MKIEQRTVTLSLSSVEAHKIMDAIGVIRYRAQQNEMEVIIQDALYPLDELLKKAFPTYLSNRG